MTKVGIIGSGNMGGAIAKGILRQNVISDSEFMISGIDQTELDRFTNDLPDHNFEVTTDNCKLAKSVEVIILAIKPIVFSKVLNEIKNSITPETVLVSIAAGVSIKDIEEQIGFPVKVVRAMPNVPLLVNCGMTALCQNSLVTEQNLELVNSIFNGCGLVEHTGEYLMDAVTAVSGSSPAYVFMFIEAMADGAVLEGIPRPTAYRMAAQSVMGAAKMVLDLELHPAVLKDMVTSPGGTTIEAVAKLEQGGLRSTVIEAMRSCAQKSREMNG